MKGIIFNIKEFAINDGPGIRETVFFKGCPLKCRWCHNPEGISMEQEIIYKENICLNCKKCLEVCPFIKNNNARVLRPNYIPPECNLCGKCAAICPAGAKSFAGYEIESDKLASELLENKDFLKKNKGGITISGGEPLAQIDFLISLLKDLKGMDITLDTSGYAETEDFKKVLDYADLVLYDIKHTDNRIHKKYTGVDNDLILKNLKILIDSRVRFIIRIPLIPGVNDSKDNMENTAFLVKDAENLLEIDLLPYNKSSGAKYKYLNKEYNPGFDVNKKPEIHPEIFEKYNIRNKIL
ncbi:MAG: glycyl-radical enzyme activating protein [Spirochaetes bacterium]|nr:glycyl-radical enzyme activating protein [Spirochaetota bacterium]